MRQVACAYVSEGGYCSGCGLEVARCRDACGRADGPAHFCGECGRRLVEYVVVPGVTAVRCRDHWEPREDLAHDDLAQEDLA